MSSSNSSPARRDGFTLARVTQVAGISAMIGVGVAMRLPKPPAARHVELTFATDVAPILYKNCASCHRAEGIAPFSVLDFEEVAPRVDKIRDRVSTGIMPPWHSDAPRGTFTNDRRLSDADRDLIVRWIDDGAKAGDLSKLPPAPTFSGAWNLGTPDAEFAMQEEFTVPASGMVPYEYFEIPTNLTEDKWVQSIEILPGAHEVVHHVLVYARVPAPAPGGAPAMLAGTPSATPAPAPAPVFIRNVAQERDPAPEAVDSLHLKPRAVGALIASEAPGTSVNVFPEGTALRLRKGTVITLQMHYTAHGHAMTDRTRIGVHFAKQPPREELFTTAFTNRQFTIPAGAKDVAVPAEIGFGQPVKIWGMLPHTHLRGTRWQYTLQMADGSSQVVLNVPRYDFNWQTIYMYAKPLEIPPGAKLMSTAWYDNSTANESNPNPKADVRWGDQTWEEMQYTGLWYTLPNRPSPAAGDARRH